MSSARQSLCATQSSAVGDSVMRRPSLPFGRSKVLRSRGSPGLTPGKQRMKGRWIGQQRVKYLAAPGRCRDGDNVEGNLAKASVETNGHQVILRPLGRQAFRHLTAPCGKEQTHLCLRKKSTPDRVRPREQ